MNKPHPAIKEHLVNLIEILKKRNAEIAAKFSQESPPQVRNAEIDENFSWAKETECADYYMRLLTELDLTEFRQFEAMLESAKAGEGMIKHVRIEESGSEIQKPIGIC